MGRSQARAARVRRAPPRAAVLAAEVGPTGILDGAAISVGEVRVADVAFDTPLRTPFAYVVPPGAAVAPGQRVLAPLGGAERAGIVVAIREGAAHGLKPLGGLIDTVPILSPAQLELVRWIARESGSSLGSTCAALLPPAGVASRVVSTEWTTATPLRPQLLVGTNVRARVLDRLRGRPGGVLLIAPDVEASADWASALASLGSVARLDSGAPARERRRAWSAALAGAAAFVVGTRSALLAPLLSPATLVLVDEHDATHKPPGAPRIHSRDVLLHRAAVEGSALLMTSATPSVETWWRADSGRIALEVGPRAPWPAMTVADTRGGVLRADPLAPALGRAAREALARGRRVWLLVSRLTSALSCDDCGVIPRCAECGIALGFSRVRTTVACRQCGREDPAPSACAACGGRRVSAFGWGAERVEHAMRRRFPRARIARYDPDAARGARLARQTEEAATADIVIGTRGALRLFAPGSLGLAGLITPDQLLRIPDFRAAERTFALAWAAAERVAPDGHVVIQSQTPDHYAIRAVVAQDLGAFYREELRFRAELGYPPFRRLCRVTAQGQIAAEARALADECVRRLQAAGLTAYPPSSDGRGLRWLIVAKGDATLAEVAAAALADLPPAQRSRGRDKIELEMDPVE